MSGLVSNAGPRALHGVCACSVRMRAWLVLLFGLGLAAGTVEAQPLTGSTEQVKAAYLYRFVAYIEWPDAALPAADSPLVIGVAVADVVHAELNQMLVGRSAHGRPLVARKIARDSSVEGVHMLYVGDPALLHSAWLQALRDRPILIVTDGPQGLDAGSALSFILVRDRVRFEASVRAAERAGLKISSRLLALAQRVVVAP